MKKEITLKTKNILIGNVIRGFIFAIGYIMLVIQSLANQQNLMPMELFAKMPALYFQMFICYIFYFSTFYFWRILFRIRE